MLRDIPYEDLDNWEYSAVDTCQWDDDVFSKFITDFQKRFPSFKECNKWVSREQHAILESKLFYIALQDNEWSLAVELLQKEDPYLTLENLQKRHYQAYLDGIREALFDQFETLGTYTGAWTSGTISRTVTKEVV